MRALVTGGAGFIASHIVDALIEKGHDVTIVDNFSAGSEDNVNPNAHLHRLDITDSEALDAVFASAKPEVVYHLAAQTSVRHSMTDTSFDARVNVIGSINALQSCVNHDVSRILFSSTCAVYSEPESVPMDETHPIRPQSAYGMAKYTVENYIRFYSDVYGLRYKVFRYGNVYGPRQSPHGEAGVVAIFTGQLMSGVQPKIFGDGSKTRDYVFVSDVVEANMIGLSDEGDNEIFNIAQGVEVSDFEIFDAVRNATDSDIEPVYGEKRAGEADRISLNWSKARKSLGWSPKVHLHDGVQQVVAHYRERLRDDKG
ncbi:MAG: NAD-dependent epimerase/dehydratase family protein [Chloroflexi bacterium]|nr:NAD-dependent epimerase/dehydratase family protein [Chloroflexota bacterium]